MIGSSCSVPLKRWPTCAALVRSSAPLSFDGSYASSRRAQQQMRRPRSLDTSCCDNIQRTLGASSLTRGFATTMCAQADALLYPLNLRLPQWIFKCFFQVFASIFYMDYEGPGVETRGQTASSFRMCSKTLPGYPASIPVQARDTILEMAER